MTNPSPDTSAVEPATAELVRRLLSLADPSAEAMDDDKRLTLLIHAANDAAKALSFPAMTSPDTSAAEVVASAWATINKIQKEIHTFERPSARTSSDLIVAALRLLKELDASRAETAAAIQDRDAWRVQCEAHAAKLIWYLEQDGELQDRALKGAEHLLRPYLTTGAVFGFTPDHKWSESSTPFVVIDAVKAVFIRAETAEAALAAANARAEALERERDETVLGSMLDIYRQRAEVDADQMAKLEAKLAKAVEALTFIASSSMSTAHDCKQAARASLTEIEGKSK